jgi:uncharacterized protein YjbI with pentapeptide repeats
MSVHLIGVCLIGVYLIGVYLMDVPLMGAHLIGVCLTGMHLTGVYLTGVYLTGVHLMGVSHRRDLTGVYLISVHFTGVHHRMQPFLLSRTYVLVAFGCPGLMPPFWQLGLPGTNVCLHLGAKDTPNKRRDRQRRLFFTRLALSQSGLMSVPQSLQ